METGQSVTPKLPSPPCRVNAAVVLTASRRAANMPAPVWPGAPTMTLDARRADQSGGNPIMKRMPFFLAILMTGAVLGVVAAHSFLHGQPTAPAAMPKELTSYRDIVKQVLPAVVSIEARSKARP